MRSPLPWFALALALAGGCDPAMWGRVATHAAADLMAELARKECAPDDAREVCANKCRRAIERESNPYRGPDGKVLPPPTEREKPADGAGGRLYARD